MATDDVLAELEEDLLDWEFRVEPPPPRRTGYVTVTFEFVEQNGDDRPERVDEERQGVPEEDALRDA